MITITLKEREIPLMLTSWEMKEVQEKIAPMGKAIDMLTGKNPEDADDKSKYGSAEHLGTIAEWIVILGNAGLEEAGEEGNLTTKKVLRSIKPADLAMAVNTCLDAIDEGMKSEIPPKKAEGPVDVTLEEINKKKERES